MLLSDALCFAFLTITVTATCAGAEITKQELIEKKPGRRTKREAIIITGYPPNNFKLDNSNQRVSKLRYWQKKPKRGSLKPLYGPPSPPSNRIPVKKYRKKPIRSKFNKYSGKRNAKPRYPSPKPYYSRPSPHPPKKPSRPQPYYSQEPAGFGEPPKELAQEYVQHPKQSYAEPPVDSYGNPLTQSFPTGLSNIENPHPSLGSPYDQQYQSLQSYNQDLNIDHNNAYTKHHPIYTKPEIEDYTQDEGQKYKESKFESYSDVYKKHPPNDFQHKKQISKHQNTHNIQKNKPWKGKLKANEYEDNPDHVIIGGKYAEPPGRLVPNYHQNVYHNEDVGADGYVHVEPEIGSSASISPYVNYKHSNMAFSPQNLNDAFSPFIN